MSIIRRTAALIFGVGFILLGVEPLVTPPWGHFIHSWWLFPLPIPYIGNIFWGIVGLTLIAYTLVGPSILKDNEETVE